MLSLSDDSTETLEPAGLRVGKDNVLYCTVKAGRFPARFNRAAYYQLSEYIEEGEDGFYLKLEERTLSREDVNSPHAPPGGLFVSPRIHMSPRVTPPGFRRKPRDGRGG